MIKAYSTMLFTSFWVLTGRAFNIHILLSVQGDLGFFYDAP